MNGQDPTRSQNVDPADYVSAVKRTSWGAVFAGVVTAIGVQLLFSLLGAAIGFTTLYAAAGDGDVGRGMAIGAGIWWLLTSIISLFIGGWVAGRLSGVLRPRDAGLHGIVVWGLTALFAFYISSSAMGAFMGGAIEVGGMAASAAAQREDGQWIVGMPAGPSDTQSFTAQVERDVDQLLQGAQTQPAAAGQDRERIMATVRANFTQGQHPNRTELMNVLVQSGIPRAQAEQKVEDWQRTWQQQQGGGTIPEAMQTLRERPEEIAQTTSKYLAGATWWSFFAMLLGAIAAMVGGYTGVPQQGYITRGGRSTGSGGGGVT